MSTTPNDPEDELAGTEQPFVAHLVELRDRLIRACIAIGVVAAVLAIWPGRPPSTTSWRRRWWRTCPRAPR